MRHPLVATSAVLAVLRGVVRGLPEGIDAILATSDLQGIVPVHIKDQLGVLPMKAVTRDALREFVRKLGDRILAEEISRATALKIWHTVMRRFLDATQSNEPGMAVLDANPARDIEGTIAKGIERLVSV